MNVKTKLLVVLGVLSIPVASRAAGSPMEDGLWEISTTMEMPGMPYKVPPTTVTHCYTKEDLKDNQKTIPQQKGDCKVTDQKYSGSKISWKMVCSGENPAKGAGEIVFKGSTAYEGTMKMETKGMAMTTKYKARRIGNCK